MSSTKSNALCLRASCLSILEVAALHQLQDVLHCQLLHLTFHGNVDSRVQPNVATSEVAGPGGSRCPSGSFSEKSLLAIEEEDTAS